MHKGHMVSGAITGTGAAINVQLGFVPEVVRIRNKTSGDSLEWSNSDGDGGTKRLAAGTASQVTTAAGVQAYNGTAAGDSAGFTLGTDADINVNAESLVYEAWSADS